MSKYLIVLGVSLLLIACATPKAQTTAQNGPVVMHGTKPPQDKNLICSRHRPMDSHIPELVCITPEQAEARKKASQSQMQNMQNGPSPTLPPPPSPTN